jgi:hypothetical protein
MVDQFAVATCKNSSRLLKLARNYCLPLTESHFSRCLFGSTVRRIEALLVLGG